jgi:hypothetical protein
MPRIRSIKPDFFKSAKLARLQYRARLTFIGLWTIADDQGRIRADPRVIAGELWPQEDDVTWADVAADLDQIESLALVTRYADDRYEYLSIRNWREHQRINKPTPSKLPPPPGEAGTTAVAVMEDSRSGVSTPDPVENLSPTSYRGEGEGEREREREGEGTPPPRKCSLHLHTETDAPCHRCRDARLAREDWDKAQKSRPTPTPQREPECDVHPGYPHPSSALGCLRCAEEVAS